jgi:regulator of extracellular matrix RemA (YlzA/DUF370 family)
MIGVLINVGYNNLVSLERIVAIVNPNSIPARRLREEAKKGGLLIDVTAGHKARSMIITSSNHILLSAIEVKTLATRFNDAALGFHERFGNPFIDELLEPGQGPDLIGSPQAPQKPKKSTPRAPVVKNIGVIKPNPNPQDDLDSDPQVSHPANSPSKPYGHNRPLKDPDYELKAKDLALLKANELNDEDEECDDFGAGQDDFDEEPENEAPLGADLEEDPDEDGIDEGA